MHTVNPSFLTVISAHGTVFSRCNQNVFNLSEVVFSVFFPFSHLIPPTNTIPAMCYISVFGGEDLIFLETFHYYSVCWILGRETS